MKHKKKNNIYRREFIELSVKSAVGASLISLPILSEIGCGTTADKTIHGVCYHDCPDRCSWTVTVRNGKVEKFEASKDNPYTAGKLCDKMVNFPNDVTYHPDRILTPLKRTGLKGSGEFEPVSWEQAIKEVAARLTTIIEQDGGEAVLPYSFGGNQGLVQSDSIAGRFFAHIGASQLERTICGNPTVAGIMATNGQTTGVLPEDIIHSRFILLWGTNPVNSNQHLWLMIEEARKRGARLVVIDPFQSQTALKADWHIQPLPGTDTALALGLMHVIFKEQLQDQDYIDNYTTGANEMKAHLQKYDVETVSRWTGLESETIIQLAKSYAQGKPSLIRVLVGLEHQTNGGSAFRAIAMLPALTGAWRQLGGGLMNMTYELFGAALNWDSLNLPAALANPKTRMINMIQLGKALNDETLKPAIRALVIFNSNPVVTTPNQNLVKRGLSRENLLTVVLEHFMTDTASYADYVFPATTVLENWDLLDSWGSTYLNINEPAIEPLGEAKTNTGFFRILSKEMGFKDDYLFESDIDIIQKTLDSDHEYLKGITFKSLKKNGWARLNLPKTWMPHAVGNFNTPSGKCNLYNAEIDPPMPEYVPFKYSDEDLKSFPFQLLTLKSPRHFLNSSKGNVSHLRKKEGKPFLDMHAVDAAGKDINDGDEIKIFNQRGAVFLTARISQKVRKGVVCMPHGYWPSLMKGGSSANALTDDLLTDMGRGGAIQEARVDVVKV
ncbi:MAG: molybdopterin-dependent oxidoreductase [Saprospiraceae bacterium]|nr:molybdopterin-dependent oxidoreductase [Saprospiraceae bacterium]